VAARTLFSHMTGFACIHAGCALQQTDLFSCNPIMAFMAVLCNRAFLTFLFKVTEVHAPEVKEGESEEEESRKDPHEMCAEMCKEEVVEAENDVASLSTSFLFVQAIRMGLTGVLPDGEGLEEPPVPISPLQQIALYLAGVGCMVAVILLLATGLATKYRNLGVLQNSLGMSFSWCFFWSTRWAVSQNATLEELRAGPESMEGRILLALMLSGLALSVIFVLDHMEDSTKAQGDASQMSAVVQNFINALSILVGFSWEHCFDFALEGVASKTSRPSVAKLLFTGIVSMIITPAWRRYILVKVLQLNQMNEEESKASSKSVMESPTSSPKGDARDSRRKSSQKKDSEEAYQGASSQEATSLPSLDQMRASKQKRTSKKEQDKSKEEEEVSEEPNSEEGSEEINSEEGE